MNTSGGPRYSVLLPTHDRADVVGYAIRSVLAQTVTDFELLVVGDGCTDDTAAVVASFGDPRIRWFDLPKAPGFGYANRNLALREARGELIAFMAHDDLYLPDHLVRLAEPFRDERVVWAYSRPVWVTDEGILIPFALDLRQPDQLLTFLTRRNSIPASCVVYRRSCIVRHGEWPEDLASGADWEYWKRIIVADGVPGIGYVEASTALHFRADWHSGRSWGPYPMDAWLQVAEGPSWPTSLRVQVPSGTTAQSYFWGRSVADQEGWPVALRTGIREAIDLLAWNGSAAMPELRTARELADKLRARVAKSEAERDRLEAERDRLRIVTQRRGRLARWTSRQLEAIWRASRLRRIARRLPNPLFDPGWYASAYPDVPRHAIGAWVHWRRHGWREERDPNPLFDSHWYRATNLDVRTRGADPLDHYLCDGAQEHRDPGPSFDGTWYLQRYPDIRVRGMNPLLHYLLYGAAEGRAIQKRRSVTQRPATSLEGAPPAGQDIW